MEMLWLFVVACGPVILGLLIAYALMTRRRRGPAERRATEEATARLYGTSTIAALQNADDRPSCPVGAERRRQPRGRQRSAIRNPARNPG
ncbi:hypothetical protein C7I84_26160 [Mesorhizobium ephedrae]|uniref:Uncharacterized protein n=1 Tax=Kumtagia ephedrae TaxID=2116701 RepID=A0A2P7RR32_9HYPH|nr:hypothetical protein C7I84_26160 [Mesorhizobium ephedrae]